MKVAIVSLGCPKNQVDADVFCRALLEAGHTTVATTSAADVVIINTCGFIQSAKEEAIEAIFDACALKKDDPEKKVVVTGCLGERYQAEITREIPELDAVVGIGCNHRLPEILAGLEHCGGDEKPLACFGPKQDLELGGARVISTPAHYAWLKIAEGCSNACSYCAIPAIRGPLRSREMESVLDEARWLAEQGVKEVVLVAQDVTAYGQDKGERWIVPLLRELDKIDGLEWIRLLYAYPEKIDEELLRAMAECGKVVRYLDLPIQHCNEEILSSMRRKGGRQAVLRAVELIRRILPDATLRTTLIVGYPGESEAQFEELCAFVKDVRFDRLGCFAYSPEEGTGAARLLGQLPEEEKQRRVDVIMRLQNRIMAEKQEALVGSRMRVICDGWDDDEGVWLCRGQADAPEIDVTVLVESDVPLVEGDFYTVEVTHADGLDLFAVCVDE